MARRLWRRVIRTVLLACLAVVVLLATLILTLRWVHPLTSAFMLEADWDAWRAHETGYRTQYHWVPLEAISPQLAIAVIASEDQQFPFHAGFDFKSIREAVQAHERGATLRGASTITQQVAKNLFLWSGRSFVRKGMEATLTVMLELLWPKDRILEVYLNVAQFGHGIYGVEAASERYFHQPAARVSRSDAAVLAGVLPNPERLHADAPSRYLLSRRDWIVGQMAHLGGPAYLSGIEAADHPGRGAPASNATTASGATASRSPAAQ
jgi:monofunctional biosynthetic peptidoglycan transglycosylase